MHQRNGDSMKKREMIVGLMRMVRSLVTGAPVSGPDFQETAGHALPGTGPVAHDGIEHDMHAPIPGGILFERDMYLYLTSNGEVWEIPVAANTRLNVLPFRANVPQWAITDGLFHPCSAKDD